MEENQSQSSQKSLESKEKWAYDVLEWLKQIAYIYKENPDVAVRAIMLNAGKIFKAMLYLVKEEHRGAIIEVVRAFVED